MQPSIATPEPSAPPPVVSQRVAQLRPDGSAVQCVLSDGRSVTLSRFLASFIRVSDQIEFGPAAAGPARELRVVQSTTRRPRELYFAPIGYVTQPRPDKRDEYFVRAEVTGGRLGISEELLFTTYQMPGSARRWAGDAGFRFLAKTGSPICYHMVFSNEK